MTPLERITLALARIAPTPQQRQRLRLAHLAATLAAARGWTVEAVIAEWRREGDHASADAAESVSERCI